MKRFFKTSLGFLLLLTLTFSFAGCSAMPKPDESVSNFFNALKKEDLTTATKYIKYDSAASTTILKYNNEEQDKVAKSVFSKLNYQIESTEIKDNTAVVKAKVTSVDLVKITGKMLTDLLPTLMAQALSGQQSSENDTDKLVDQYFSNSINDPNVSLTTTDVTMNLVKSDDKKNWLIVPNDDLTNAMTGNLQKAFSSFNGNK